MENKAVSVECFENFVVLKRRGNKDVCISLSTLRLSCPCAFCSGERDVLGNKYGGSSSIDDSVSVVRYEKIGHYGLQFFWSDGHKDGIYTFEHLNLL